MQAIPITPLTLDIARRTMWFEPPELALADPVRFVTYAMTYARHEDMRVIRRRRCRCDAFSPAPSPHAKTEIAGIENFRFHDLSIILRAGWFSQVSISTPCASCWVTRISRWFCATPTCHRIG